MTELSSLVTGYVDRQSKADIFLLLYLEMSSFDGSPPTEEERELDLNRHRWITDSERTGSLVFLAL